MNIKKKFAIAALCSGLSVGAVAEPQTGDQLLTLAGSGASNKDFEANVFNLSFDYGKYMSPESVFGVRQSVGIADTGDDNSWNGATRIFYDYHFGTTQWRPFVGANIGGVYGDGVEETGFAGPEAGVKYFIKDDTFLQLQAEYQFFFDSSDEATDNFDDGSFVYSLGMGITF